jgi:diguanylate cyclase (GGDEF)-like protein
MAPYAAGSLLLGTGVCAAAHTLGLPVPPGPLGASPWPVAMLVGGSGAGTILSAWDHRRTKRKLKRAREDVQRANAQRDVAMLQSRRMRAQAEGLALMREIHRSTGIPVRQERLHRILTLLADLFEAREVSLFAVAPDYSALANSGPRSKVQPAACIRTTNKEEFFAVFDSDDLHQALAAGTNAAQSASGTRTSKRWLRVAAKSATIVREGCQLYVEGSLETQGVPVAKAQWRRGAHAESDALSQFDPGEILDVALAKLDLSEAAVAFAAEALDRRRTTRQEEHLNPTQSGASDGLTLCVPLLADQKAVGVLRIRRSIEGFSGPEAGALEELLLESAKHIALALKKDEDDRKAITDVLTGLFIKRHFLVTLEQMRAEAAASGNGFCLVLCDIDHFKKVNDTHGHLTGDMILKGVAGVLRKCLRTGDTAFRYGGEEMALLLPNATPESAEQTAERLRAAVQSATFNGERGQRVPVTISLGISQHQPGLTGEALIGRADRALYASKQGGRNRATKWSVELPDPLAKAEAPH